MNSNLADETNIYLLFSNLIGNTIKHNENPEPRINLSYYHKKEGLHHYVPCDNGHGIPPGVMERFFFPFVKAGPNSGTGIGLATTKKIIDVYWGEIKAYNDNGACFEFSIADPSA